MNILTEISFNIDEAALRKHCRVSQGTEDAARIASLVQLALEKGRPKVGFTVCYIDTREKDQIQISDVVFNSRTLAHNLEQVERIFPYIATCGIEMDLINPAGGDLLMSYCWDQIKTAMLMAANEQFLQHLIRVYRLLEIAVMHPGSGDTDTWPIEQQAGLFSLLGDVESNLGVKLTESFLMIPDKTISGIVYPSERDFQSCQVCHRENCPNRQAPFDPELWAEIHLGRETL